MAEDLSHLPLTEEKKYLSGSSKALIFSQLIRKLSKSVKNVTKTKLRFGDLTLFSRKGKVRQTQSTEAEEMTPPSTIYG